MQRFFLTILSISVLLNLFFILTRIQSKNIYTKPPWEPFELNSNLTLRSLVEDGYRFGGMPCGQVQYFKTIADTTIQYEVGLDCNSYSIFRKQFLELFNIDYHFQYKEPIAEDSPSFPFDLEQVKNCYQGIYWRVYSFKMNKPDINKIREFVESKSCGILTSTVNWNEDGSGSMIVYNYENYLYFDCQISKLRDDEISNKDLEWEFQIISYIPYLDSKRIINEAKRRTQIELFHLNQSFPSRYNEKIDIEEK